MSWGTPPITSKARTWASIQSGQRLRPGRLGEGEARGPQYRDEDLRHADFAGEPIDDDGNAVAGVIDEQPLASGMRLAHRHRQRLLEGSIKLAEPRAAVAAWVRGDVFVPQDQQGDVLALQFAMHVGGGVKLTEARRHVARPPSRERRSMPRGRATRPRQQSVWPRDEMALLIELVVDLGVN
jgi:hypothetical protein